MLLAASVLGWMVAILIILSFVGWLVFKATAGSMTRCPHCGYDSGIPASRAKVCQKCGRNRLVRSSRRARRR